MMEVIETEKVAVSLHVGDQWRTQGGAQGA